MPEDMSGKSILVIGANDGIHAFEAEERGADRVLATDIWDKEWIGKDMVHSKRALELVREYKNSNIEYKSMGLLDIDSAEIGTFDYVLCASVFTYIKHPYLAIRKLSEVTDDTLILYHTYMKRPKWIPVMEMVGNQEGNVRWKITMNCMKNMLNATGFSEIESSKGSIPGVVVPEGHIMSETVIYQTDSLSDPIKRVTTDQRIRILYTLDGKTRIELLNSDDQGWVHHSNIFESSEKTSKEENKKLKSLRTEVDRFAHAFSDYNIREFVDKGITHVVKTATSTGEPVVMHAKK